jgi:hypothetical protein
MLISLGTDLDIKVKGKVKVVLVLNKVQCHEDLSIA